MALYLGIDTSNYTTSAALYDDRTGDIRQKKQLLPVKEGAVGQRQSDAVFGHVKTLGTLVEALRREEPGSLAAVGVSVRPQDQEGSYMPCFLAGEMAARTAAAAVGVPLRLFSHQAGHVAAALYGAGRPDLRNRSFLAFHVSGGTTQCLHVAPDRARVFAIRTLARSLDLHAGQAVDRVGAKLGLPFPAGPVLEELAARSGADYRPKVAFKGMDCCLSGLENQCARLLREGESPADVAKYCLCYLREMIRTMTEKAARVFPGLPILYAGGVMSNRFLQDSVRDRYPESLFAPPAYSADNGAGIALLCGWRHGKEDGVCS